MGEILVKDEHKEKFFNILRDFNSKVGRRTKVPTDVEKTFINEHKIVSIKGITIFEKLGETIYEINLPEVFIKYLAYEVAKFDRIKDKDVETSKTFATKFPGYNF